MLFDQAGDFIPYTPRVERMADVSVKADARTAANVPLPPCRQLRNNKPVQTV